MPSKESPTLRRPATDRDVTQLLEAWSQGDLVALDRLLPLVFEDLHRMARYFFQRESDTHTLQPTALVSEVYFRLRGQKKLVMESRKDFFSFAAEIMRHLLCDYARRRQAEKRSAGQADVPLDGGLDHLLSSTPATEKILDVHAAVEELRQVDPRQAEIVTLRHFLGLQVVEVAELLEISPSTVKRDWRTAKYWLQRRLRGDSS